MCEDLEKTYNELLAEYQKTVMKKMAAEDYLQYNEILFSAHSLGIEGSSYTINDTKALKELGLGVVPQNKPLVETMEMLDHFHAYEQMLAAVQSPLTEDYVLSLHATLTHHTISYRHPGASPGEYTTMDMGAGDTLFGDHEQLIKRVPDLLAHTERAIQKGLPPMFTAAVFHGHFIYLHPFRDGNGRMARLLSNKILLQAGHPILIITRESKEEYVRALKLFHKDSAEYLVAFFYESAIKRMRGEMEEKKRNTIKGLSFLL